MTKSKRWYKSLLAALVFLQPSTVVQAQEQLLRRVQLGGYHEAAVNDSFVEDASKFALLSLQHEHPFTGFSLDSIEAIHLKVVHAQTQVVAGMNIRLTLEVMDGDDCVSAFDVDIYNHFGDMTLSKWGAEHTCDEALAIQNEFKTSTEPTEGAAIEIQHESSERQHAGDSDDDIDEEDEEENEQEEDTDFDDNQDAQDLEKVAPYNAGDAEPRDFGEDYLYDNDQEEEEKDNA